MLMYVMCHAEKFYDFFKNVGRSLAAVGRQQALGAASPRQRRLPVPEQGLVPGRETHGGRAGDRDMDRHNM